ncbi:MAG: VWA domain-containing protein [Chlorobiaceae bacterium]|nr:VWA domain-containing protein [Chlorobiaceae bacterium]
MMMDFFRIASGVSFDEPWWLVLLPVAVLLALFMWFYGRKELPGVLYPSVGAVRYAGFAANPLISMLPVGIRWLALYAALLALAGPRAPFPASDRNTTGIDIMLALDVSESMKQTDFGGKTRFSAAREAAMRFIDNRPSDRIGLIVFSGGSFTRCPLTIDHEVLGRLAETITPGFFEEPGTAIGTAVLTATNRLKPTRSKEKVLVLLTDGENNTGEVSPVTAARLAAQNGIRIYTVFAGKDAQSSEAGKSPALSMKGRQELAEVARISGGAMFNAGDLFGLMKSFRDIDRLEKTRLKSHMPGRSVELYPWLLMSAVILLVVEQSLLATRFMRIP